MPNVSWESEALCLNDEFRIVNVELARVDTSFETTNRANVG